MAISKADSFPQKDQDISIFAKAIAHPARISILKFLAGNGVSESGAISKAIPLSQSTIAQHLNSLIKVNMILADNHHIKVQYSINPECISQMQELFNALLDSLKKKME